MKEEREKKERIGSHWLTMDPRVEMAFLIHIASGELEHRRDRGLLGELEFLQGLVSGLHLRQN